MKIWLRFIELIEIAISSRIAHSINILVSLIFISLFFSDIVLAQAQLGEDIDGEAADDASGYSVSLSADGRRLAIGAPGNDSNGDNSGHVRIYEWSGTTWEQLGADIDGEAAHDSSGSSVSLSADGRRLAIGASGNDGNGDNSGHVRVYEWSGTTWEQLGADIDGKAANDYSGLSVSLSKDGQRLAIAANADDANWYKVGLVRVYQWMNAEWVQLGADIRGEQEFDYFGSGVSLSSDGNRWVAGAVQNDGISGSWSGHARAYQWSDPDWVQLGSDIDGEAAYDHSGDAVSLSANGNRLAIGAIMNDGGGENSGHVRIYEWTGKAWAQLGGDLDGEAAFDFFGSGVSISADGSRLTVGAYGSDDNAGRVRVYDWSGTTWAQIGTGIVGEAEGDEIGESLSLSSNGDRLAIGAPRNDGNGSDSGHVRVFDLGMGNGFEINPGLNDAWFNTATIGQGFLITVFPTIKQVFLAWFTYDTERPPENVEAMLGEPGHRWLTAQGPYEGDTATLSIYVTEGGVFDASDPAATNDGIPDGTMTIEFADCTEGLVTYEISSPNVSGEIPIQRITKDNVALCESLSDQ